MKDSFGRPINYLRLSITDRCNLRCCYCMPATGVPACSHTDMLSYEDLLCVAEVAAGIGIEKVRVTGGEPLVRKGVIDFLARLGRVDGLSEITMTTNGLLLEELAGDLKTAGVERLNVSLDSLDPETYRRITRGGDLQKVMRGLDKAATAGLRLKLNMVVMRGINDHEVEDFAALSLDRPWSVRFIEYMPTIREKAWRNRVVAGSEILEHLQSRFPLEPLSISRLCGPAKPYRIVGATGSVGIITPMTDHFCGDCNRIRITAQGFAKSCLLSHQSVDLKPALNQGAEVVRTMLQDVINGKADQHHFLDDHYRVQMSGIGG